MGQQDVRHAAVKARLPRGDPAGDLFGVAFFRLFFFEARLVGIGQRVDVDALTLFILKDEKVFARFDGADGAVALQREMPPSASEEIDAVLFCNGRGGRQADAVVVVPRDDDDCALCPRKLFDGMEKGLLCFGGRKIGIENIARDEHDGDILLLGDAGKLMKRFDLFGQTVPVHEPLADMPIRCVENVHPEKCVLMSRKNTLLLRARYDILKQRAKLPFILHYYTSPAPKKQADERKFGDFVCPSASIPKNLPQICTRLWKISSSRSIFRRRTATP